MFWFWLNRNFTSGKSTKLFWRLLRWFGFFLDLRDLKDLKDSKNLKIWEIWKFERLVYCGALWFVFLAFVFRIFQIVDKITHFNQINLCLTGLNIYAANINKFCHILLILAKIFRTRDYRGAIFLYFCGKFHQNENNGYLSDSHFDFRSDGLHGKRIPKKYSLLWIS